MVAKWTRRRFAIVSMLALGSVAGVAFAGSATSARDPRPLPPGKAELERFMQDFQRQGRPATRAEVLRAANPVSTPDPKPFEGISNEGVSSPLPPHFFVFGRSSWQKIFGPRLVTVYAATLGADPDQGTLVVFTRSLPSVPGPEQIEGRFESYPTRRKVGMLSIESERGGLIHAVSLSGGEEFTFDFAARKYVAG